MIRPPRSSPLFPYPPLFRSRAGAIRTDVDDDDVAALMTGCVHAESRRARPGRMADLALDALRAAPSGAALVRSEEHTSELQSQSNLVCRLLLEKKKQHRKHTQRLRHILDQHLQYQLLRRIQDSQPARALRDTHNFSTAISHLPHSQERVDHTEA